MRDRQTNNHKSKAEIGPLAFGRGITDVDMERLEERFSAECKTEKQFRDAAIYFVATRTALRAGEIVSLQWSRMLKTPGGTITFAYRKKGGQIGFAVPGEHAISTVRTYHDMFSIQSDFLFMSLPNRAKRGERSSLSIRSLQRLIHQWGVEMNIQICRPRIHTRTGEMTNNLHCHALRHTSIQKVFDSVGAVAAQKLASHATPATTSKFYTKPFFDASQVLSWPRRSGPLKGKSTRM